ncbi:MAG: hypothetical protein DMD81_07765 [Candidatus Rokuibacteriota bacterium]|nr:MAG: hypothetical protein DMD81_07765 [Candidatus Rokubacteria bacterium]
MDSPSIFLAISLAIFLVMIGDRCAFLCLPGYCRGGRHVKTFPSFARRAAADPDARAPATGACATPVI